MKRNEKRFRAGLLVALCGALYAFQLVKADAKKSQIQIVTGSGPVCGGMAAQDRDASDGNLPITF